MLPYRVACPPPGNPRPKLRRFAPIRGIPAMQSLLLATSALQLLGQLLLHGALLYSVAWLGWPCPVCDWWC